MLHALKVPALNQLALLCGFPIPATTKAARVDGILRGLNLIATVPSTTSTNILSIDIGLKNFSHCFAANVDLTNGNNRTTVNTVNTTTTTPAWSKYDLHSKYAPSHADVIAPSTLLDQKRYLNHLADKLSDDLLVLDPNIVVIENQRTRSRGNPITLPNVLLNYSFENTLYTNLYLKNPRLVLVPMHSSSMVNFWLNRFVTKPSLAKNSKMSKTFRAQLFFNWLDRNVVFDLRPSPAIDRDLALPKKVKLLLNHLHINENEASKIDDLIDSLLYTLTIKQQLANLLVLRTLLDNGSDLNAFIYERNSVHLDLIKDLVSDYNLELTSDFSSYT